MHTIYIYVYLFSKGKEKQALDSVMWRMLTPCLISRFTNYVTKFWSSL